MTGVGGGFPLQDMMQVRDSVVLLRDSILRNSLFDLSGVRSLRYVKSETVGVGLLVMQSCLIIIHQQLPSCQLCEMLKYDVVLSSKRSGLRRT